MDDAALSCVGQFYGCHDWNDLTNRFYMLSYEENMGGFLDLVTEGLIAERPLQHHIHVFMYFTRTFCSNSLSVT